MDNTQFHLVRHGQTVWNSQGRIQGSKDSPLTERGIADAEAAARRLSEESFSAIFTSDLPRAYETARIIATASAVALHADPRLRETNNGIFEGKTRAEAASEFPKIFAEHAERSPDYALPGGESRRSVQNRAIDFFTEIAKIHPGERLVAVSHGGLLSAFVCAILDLPLSRSRTFWVSNGGISLVTYIADDEGSWRIETLNETQHLRPRNP